MDIAIKVLILFILLTIIYELICRILIWHGFNIKGGIHKSMLDLKQEDFTKILSFPYDENQMTPDYHFKKLIKRWVFENDWVILSTDTEFYYEDRDKSYIEKRNPCDYIPDAVISNGKKIVMIEFDERQTLSFAKDNSFHSKRLTQKDIDENTKFQYTKKWHNYNLVLKKSNESKTQICLLRVAYGRGEKSNGAFEPVDLTKEINDFKEATKVKSKATLLLNNYNGDLDQVVVKTLNYIDQAENVSGSIILIHYDGISRKIKSGIITGDKIERLNQGDDYIRLLGWKL